MNQSAHLSIDHQIQAVEHELNRRRREFPLLVRRGALPQGEANLELELMGAVLKTLRSVRNSTSETPLFKG